MNTCWQALEKYSFYSRLTAERQMGRDQRKMKATGLRERRSRRVRPLVAPFAARPGGAWRPPATPCCPSPLRCAAGSGGHLASRRGAGRLEDEAAWQPPASAVPVPASPLRVTHRRHRDAVAGNIRAIGVARRPAGGPDEAATPGPVGA